MAFDTFEAGSESWGMEIEHLTALLGSPSELAARALERLHEQTRQELAAAVLAHTVALEQRVAGGNHGLLGIESLEATVAAARRDYLRVEDHFSRLHSGDDADSEGIIKIYAGPERSRVIEELQALYRLPSAAEPA